MDECFKYHNIPKEERLSYAIDHLIGRTYSLWTQEEDYRWEYQEPTIITWGHLKWIMREKYAPRSLEPRDIIPETIEKKKETSLIPLKEPQTTSKQTFVHPWLNNK